MRVGGEETLTKGSSLVEVKYKPIKCLARRAGGARSEQNS